MRRPNSEKRDTNNPEIIKSLDIRSLGAAAAFTQIQARSRLRKARGKIQNVMAVTAAPLLVLANQSSSMGGVWAGRRSEMIRGDGHENCSKTNMEGKPFNAGRGAGSPLSCCQLRKARDEASWTPVDMDQCVDWRRTVGASKQIFVLESQVFSDGT